MESNPKKPNTRNLEPVRKCVDEDKTVLIKPGTVLVWASIEKMSYGKMGAGVFDSTQVPFKKQKQWQT